MPLTRLRIATALATTSFLLVLATGCGSGTTTIEGQVSFGGTPVDGGAIVFIPKDGKDVAGGARIVGGKYVVSSKAERLPPGTYKVQITWPKGTGKKVKGEDPGEMIEETQEVIPLEYNVQSKLSAEIKSGSNTHNFELKAGGAVAAPPTKGKVNPND